MHTSSSIPRTTSSGTICTPAQDFHSFDRVAARIAAIPKGEFKEAKWRAIAAVSKGRTRRIDAAVINAIAGHINAKTGDCWPGYKRLALLAGCSLRSIPIALGRLEASGMLLRQQRRARVGDLASNRYTLPCMLPAGAAASLSTPHKSGSLDANLRYPTPKSALPMEHRPPTQILHTSTPEPDATRADGLKNDFDEVEDDGYPLDRPAPYLQPIIRTAVGQGQGAMLATVLQAPTHRVLRTEHGVRDIEAFERWFLAWAYTRPDAQRPRDLDAVALSFAARALPRASRSLKYRLLLSSRWLLATDGAGLAAAAKAEGWHAALAQFVDREDRMPSAHEAAGLRDGEMRAALGMAAVCPGGQATTAEVAAFTGPAVSLADINRRRSGALHANWQKLRVH